MSSLCRLYMAPTFSFLFSCSSSIATAPSPGCKQGQESQGVWRPPLFLPISLSLSRKPSGWNTETQQRQPGLPQPGFSLHTPFPARCVHAPPIFWSLKCAILLTQLETFIMGCPSNSLLQTSTLFLYSTFPTLCYMYVLFVFYVC